MSVLLFLSEVYYQFIKINLSVCESWNVILDLQWWEKVFITREVLES